MSKIIRSLGDWLHLQGVVYGLQQPTMMGHVSVAELPQGRMADVRESLQLLLDEAVPSLPDAVPQPEQLARLMAFCCVAVLRQNRIAVADEFRVSRRKVEASVTTEAAFELAIPCPRRQPGLAALQWSMDIMNRVAGATLVAGDAPALREGISAALKPHADPGLNRFHILRAAQKLDIPVHPVPDSLLVLGTGEHTRLLNSTITDRTPSIGVGLAKGKQRMGRLLRLAGLPGADNVMVRTSEEAVKAANAYGYPVVVKPDDRDQGDGVAADLRDDAAVAAAYDAAARLSPNVLVEKFFDGATHRILVLEGRVIRVARRLAGGVVGDGATGLAELVRRKQQTRLLLEMRALHGHFGLQLDDEARGMLRQNGLDESYVPAAGEYVRLRRRDNINAGGTNEELAFTDPSVVHPDNLQLAIDAAAVARLDFSGIDLLSRDISRSWLETGALICEINAQPQVGLAGLFEKILPMLLPGGGRIPAQLIVCPAAEAERQAALASALASGHFDGIADIDGLHVAGRRVTLGFGTACAAGRALLMRTDVRRAACLMSPEDIVRHGLPLNRWDTVHFSAPGAFDAREQAMLERVRALIAGPAL